MSVIFSEKDTVEINIDGETDPCSKNEDVNFVVEGKFHNYWRILKAPVIFLSIKLPELTDETPLSN